jgi:hypothetical protein
MGRRVSVRVVGKTIGGYWPQHLAARAGKVILPDSFLAVDLGALSRSCSRPIHGLIGADFLRNRITQIDFAARKIRLLRDGGIHGAGHVIQLEEGPWGIAVPVTVSGEKVRMVRIDTGCASAMHWTRKGGAPTASVRQPVVAFSDFALPTGTADLQIGSFRVGPIPVLLHRHPVLGRELGLLGNGVWSRFASVTIDLRSDRLVICP